MSQTLQNTSLDFPEQQEVYDFLDTVYTTKHKTIIAISWWPDSMFATTVMHNYWQKKQWNTKNLTYIYCDHKVRKHSDDKTIKAYIAPYTLQSIERKKSDKNTENELRKRRYQKINECAKKINATMLITWHHLSDRIESTLLHMLRGCSIDGFMSMWREEKNSHLFAGTILRPLLSLSKKYILSLCSKHHIPYVVDISNKDTTMSKRNKVRHDIIEPLLSLANKNTIQDNTFEKSMKQIYTELEHITIWEEEKLRPMPMCYHRKTTRAYRRDRQQKDITSTKLKHICKQLHISTNTTQKNIQDITTFLQKNTSGHKYINKTYFFISHGKIYIIQWPKKFRENPTPKKTKTIEAVYTTTYGEIHETNKRRFAKSNDKIQGKNRNKRCINKKIPIFRRKSIALVTDKNNTIKPYVYDFMY